jgi:hypothetical protein
MSGRRLPRSGLLASALMSAQSDWTFGTSTLHRIVESEGPILSPFEIFGDCTQAHLEENRSWLVPRFQDAASGTLIITIQSFLIRQNDLTVLVDACALAVSGQAAAPLSNVMDSRRFHRWKCMNDRQPRPASKIHGCTVPVSTHPPARSRPCDLNRANEDRLSEAMACDLAQG